MPSHPNSYMYGQRLHSPVWGWMWWLMPYVPLRGYCPRFDDTESLHRNAQWYQEQWHCDEKQHGVHSDPEEEDSSGKSGGCQLSVWVAGMAWHDRHPGWGPRHPETESDCRAEAGKAVWEVRLEQLGVLITRAGEFHPFAPGWIPFSPWNPVNLAVLIVPNMWLKWPVTPHWKSDLDRFSCHWWKKSVHICETCWIQAQFIPARVCGVMLWCWFERRTGVYASA